MASCDWLQWLGVGAILGFYLDYTGAAKRDEKGGDGGCTAKAGGYTWLLKRNLNRESKYRGNMNTLESK